MDSSIHHDPFAPEDASDASDPVSFRANRWRAVGATDEEVASYASAHNELDDSDKANNNIIVDQADDDQMREWLDQDRAAAEKAAAPAPEPKQKAAEPKSPAPTAPRKTASRSGQRSGARNRTK